jgi:hypothetical protein
MSIEVFQACPKIDHTHESMGLTQDLWYFWVDNYRRALGGYKRFDQAELHYQQYRQAMRVTPHEDG